MKRAPRPLLVILGLGLLGSLGCGAARPAPQYRPSASLAKAERAVTVRLMVVDEREDPRYLGQAIGPEGIEQKRLELGRSAGEVVRQAFSTALVEFGYLLSDEADVIYRINVREFSAGYGYKVGSSHSRAKVALHVSVERKGSVVSNRAVTGHSEIADPSTSTLGALSRWTLGGWAEWWIAGVPGVNQATTEALSQAVNEAIEDRQLVLALDPYAAVGGAAKTAAQEGPLYRRRRAIVIGISDYWLWPPLDRSVADARRVAQALKTSGFDEVIEVYDEQATRERILRLLGTELQSKTQEGDLVLIYFAGHGDTETLQSGEKRGYIIPVDGDSRWVFSTAISMAELRDLSDRLAAKHIYFAMAACYSGIGFAQPLPALANGDGHLTRVRSARSVQMITAGKENEKTLGDGGEGIFTSFWIRALFGEADRDGNGYVTGSEIAEYVAFRVKMATGNRQSPQYGRLDGSGEALFPVR